MRNINSNCDASFIFICIILLKPGRSCWICYREYETHGPVSLTDQKSETSFVFRCCYFHRVDLPNGYSVIRDKRRLSPPTPPRYQPLPKKSSTRTSLNLPGASPLPVHWEKNTIKTNEQSLSMLFVVNTILCCWIYIYVFDFVTHLRCLHLLFPSFLISFFVSVCTKRKYFR